jgi:hypothetical protein
MKCIEKGCSGEVDNQNSTTVSFGCCGSVDGFPCTICGRLYDKDGDPIDYECGPAFLVDGEVIEKIRT